MHCERFCPCSVSLQHPARWRAWRETSSRRFSHVIPYFSNLSQNPDQPHRPHGYYCVSPLSGRPEGFLGRRRYVCKCDRKYSSILRCASAVLSVLPCGPNTSQRLLHPHTHKDTHVHLTSFINPHLPRRPDSRPERLPHFPRPSGRLFHTNFELRAFSLLVSYHTRSLLV